MVKLLLRKGADVDAVDAQGKTPLQVLKRSMPKLWVTDFHMQRALENGDVHNVKLIQARSRGDHHPNRTDDCMVM